MSMLMLKIEVGCYEVKIEKAMQCLLRMEPGTWAASAVPLNYNSWKTTIRHNPLLCPAPVIMDASVVHTAATQ